MSKLLNLPKLTKEEKRFSELDRPDVGETVEFIPVIKLCNDVYVKDKRLIEPRYMKAGAKCEVKGNTEHLVVVAFNRCTDRVLDIVSPDYLVRRQLTNRAKDAFGVLSAKRVN